MKPISLDLRTAFGRPVTDVPDASLDSVERDLHRVLAQLAAVVGNARTRTVYVPSELLMQAVAMLMPPERMGVLGGRQVGDRFVLSTLHDVTGRAHIAHVRADPQKLANALVMMERAGAILAAWIHSHPGSGGGATMPSIIDRDQYAGWVRDYTEKLVGIIVVRDGFIRFWGDAVESGSTRVEMLGDGVRADREGRHVYRLV